MTPFSRQVVLGGGTERGGRGMGVGRGGATTQVKTYSRVFARPEPANAWPTAVLKSLSGPMSHVWMKGGRDPQSWSA